MQAEAVAQARSKAEAGSQGATQALVRPHTEAGAETPTDANAEASIEAIAKTETETEAQWEMEQDSPRKHMLSKETDGPAVVTSASPFLAGECYHRSSVAVVVVTVIFVVMWSP